MRTFRKSAGTLCTAPGEIAFLVIDFILHRYAMSEFGRREKLTWTTVYVIDGILEFNTLVWNRGQAAA